MTLDLLSPIARVTVAASVAIALVMVARRPVREIFGARIAYAFWLIVPAVTLAALLPARRIIAAAVPANIGVAVAPVAEGKGIAVNPGPASGHLPLALPDLHLEPVLILLWGLGFAVSLGLLIQRQQQFLKRNGLHGLGDFHVAQSDAVGPVVIGLFKPTIVVPRDFDSRYSALERDLILEHEREHVRSGDLRFNALAALMQCLCWFNPLVHAALPLFRIDQELACDARVMRRHSRHRRIYAEALLKAQSAGQGLGQGAPLGCAWPMAGGSALKQRISQLSRSQPAPRRLAFGAILCALSACATGAVAWAALPAQTVEAGGRPGLFDPARTRGEALVAALKAGDVARARALMAAGADVNHYTRGDGTPLIIAIQLGDFDLVRALISAGADVNEAAPGDGNALIVAAQMGRVDIMTFLVEKGAAIDGYVPYDETPLINAASDNRLEAAAYLIARGADINLAVDSHNGGLRPQMRSPLGQARRNGHTEMIRLLESHGAKAGAPEL